ncbi:hypothetical protein D3C84_613360 [compost metagenome]
MVLAHHLDNLQRRLTGARREAAHFIGYHRKPAPVLSGTGRFDRRVERQQVGLIGNAANGLHDGADDVGLFAHGVDAQSRLVQVPGNVLDDLHRLLHHLGALARADVVLYRSAVGRFCGGLQGGHLVGDIAGELDHLVQPPLGVEQRVVGGFQEYRLTLLVPALETMGVIFAAVERSPEIAVTLGLGFGTVAEQAVMLPHHFVERVLHGFQEVLVGGDDLAFGCEFDHGHRAADRGEPAFVFVFLVDPCGDVGGHLDHTFHLPVGAQHRHVTGFEPDLPATLVQAQKGPAQRLAPRQVTP